ncbi:MAG: orotidine-5'-phosphate decarboxylase [Chloroflexi bacterium]|nr:orotidine-5'-phosphate decarboxylase [Chloroflexota bacterium]
MKAIDKYNARVEAAGSLLCIGLDSDSSRIPADFQGDPAPQLAFNRSIIDATAEYATAFKFNTAFYEANGADGWRQLAASVEYLRQRHPEILTICDAKRADIGNTSAAYAQSIFGELGFDAVTLNPYLGRDALQPFLDYKDRASIIVCRSSNPGSEEIQNLTVGGRPLWQVIAERVADGWNGHGNCMLVASATTPEDMARMRSLVGDMTLLVPGIGAQGGDISAVLRAGLNGEGRGLIINSSRAILFADDPAAAAAALRDAINASRFGLT